MHCNRNERDIRVITEVKNEVLTTVLDMAINPPHFLNFLW